MSKQISLDSSEEDESPLLAESQSSQAMHDAQASPDMSAQYGKLDGPLGNSSPSAVEEQVTHDSVEVTHVTYKRRWFGVAVIALLNFMSAFSIIVYAPIADITREYFKLSSATPINWLYISATFVYVAVSPLSFVTTRQSAKVSLTVGAGTLITGAWLRYLGTRVASYPCLLLGSILCGASQPFALNTPSHYSDLWFRDDGRVTATALMSLASPLGQAIGTLVVPFMATEASDLPKATLHIALLFTLTTWFAILIPSRPPQTSLAPRSMIHHSSTLSSLHALSTNPEYLCILVTFSIYVAAFSAFASLTQQFIHPYGFSDIQAGIIGAVTVLSGLLAGALTAPLLDKTKAYRIPISLCVSLSSLAYFGLFFAIRKESTLTFALIVILSSTVGASGLILLPLSLELATDLTLSQSPPELNSAILWMGGQLLSGLFIVLMDALRRDGRYSYSLIFLLLVTLLPLPFAYRLVTSRRVRECREAAAIPAPPFRA